jgi:uracil-DNA glycosylase
VRESLRSLSAEVTVCRRCPRLVAWREQVGRERRAAYREETYWARPLPGFGDPRAKIVLLGLAPAAHGGNRTGRIFTGDRSGDFLFASLWRAGLASQPTSVARGDGLRLVDTWVTAAVRCAPPANRPTGQERDRCLPWSVRELSLLPEARVIVCLGAFAWDAALRLRAALEADAARMRTPRPAFAHGASAQPIERRPAFAHGALAAAERLTLLGCYHPSQQNTFTGRLTEQMIDSVLCKARELSGLPVSPPPP